MNANVRKQASGPKKSAPARPPIVIVHLDAGGGRAFCGQKEPYPSSAHRLAIAASPHDACLTCSWVKNRDAVVSAP